VKLSSIALIQDNSIHFSSLCVLCASAWGSSSYSSVRVGRNFLWSREKEEM